MMFQYNQMKQYDIDNQLSDLLTSYIQHFKAVLSTKLTLLQSLCLNSHSLQANPQFLLAKFNNKKFQNDWPTDPQTYVVVSEHSSTLTRFYLRIQEYLEYRLGPLLTVNEGIFSREVANFQKQLEKTVRKFQASLSQTKSIGQLFALISQIQIAFTNRLIDKIKVSKPTLLKGLLDHEFIEETKRFFTNKINHQQNEGLKPLIVPSQTTEAVRQHKFSFANNLQSLRIKGAARKKTYSKLQTPVSNLTNIFTSPLSNQSEKALWMDKETNQEDETNDLQNYLTQTQKQKIQAAYSLLQLEQSSSKAGANKQQLFTQLQHRNLKNKIHLNSYLSKYQRKIRKRSVKQESQKVSRSAAKSIKNNTPNYQEANNFLQQIESLQTFTAIPRNPSDTLNKKGDNALQLPLIASRHNRGITQQK